MNANEIVNAFCDEKFVAACKVFPNVFIGQFEADKSIRIIRILFHWK